MGRFLPADHSRGDDGTLGGYVAVHARPPAFEGTDGLSYSAELEVDDTGDADMPVGGYLFFVQWGRGSPTIQGHLESDILVRGRSEDAVRAELGAMPLAEVKRILDDLIRRRWA
ncbi:MAG TPA: hypothetical protein VFK13_15540 [Gemmatimonadaceae bacterium]|nr:hypothetical protein [Gemmatimonadaceae bacterium]